jgi:hypothetical protein
MSEPITVAATEGFTPELRDRLISQLAARLDDPVFRILTPVQLRRLARLESSSPLLSLYLDLSPERRRGEAWKATLHHFVHELTEHADEKTRAELHETFAAIENSLRHDMPELGRGVVFFAARPLGLWRAFVLPVSLSDHCVRANRPYIRPLVRLRDEHDRFVLALLDHEHLRLFVGQIGLIEEVLRVHGPTRRALIAHHTAPLRRDLIEREVKESEARLMARLIGTAFAQFEARHLLLACSPELEAEIRAALPPAIAAKVGGRFKVSMEAKLGEIAAAAHELQEEIEAREELATVTAALEAPLSATAWGVQETLDALHEGRVMRLVVDDTLRLAGFVCQRCQAAYEAEAPHCPRCGGPLQAVDDLVERAIEMALDQDAALELVRSPRARERLASRAPMMAFLRW